MRWLFPYLTIMLFLTGHLCEGQKSSRRGFGDVAPEDIPIHARDEDYLHPSRRTLLCVLWGCGTDLGGTGSNGDAFQCAESGAFCGNIAPEVSCCALFEFCKAAPGNPFSRTCQR